MSTSDNASRRRRQPSIPLSRQRLQAAVRDLIELSDAWARCLGEQSRIDKKLNGHLLRAIESIEASVAQRRSAIEDAAIARLVARLESALRGLSTRPRPSRRPTAEKRFVLHPVLAVGDEEEFVRELRAAYAEYLWLRPRPPDATIDTAAAPEDHEDYLTHDDVRGAAEKGVGYLTSRGGPAAAALSLAAWLLDRSGHTDGDEEELFSGSGIGKARNRHFRRVKATGAAPYAATAGFGVAASRSSTVRFVVDVFGGDESDFEALRHWHDFEVRLAKIHGGGPAGADG